MTALVAEAAESVEEAQMAVKIDKAEVEQEKPNEAESPRYVCS